MKNLGAAAICFTGALLASNVVQAAWQGNWLVGASGGWDDLAGRINVTIIHENAASGRQTIFTQEMKETGFIGGLFAGYQARCHRVLLGAEISGDWEDINEDRPFVFTASTGDAWVSSERYKRDFTWALSGRFGYALNDYFMPYVRLGVETSHDKFSYSARVPADGNSIAVSDSDWIYRLVAGIGAEMPLPKWRCFTVRAEYDYHGRGEAINASGRAVLGAAVFASMKPYANSGKLSLVWNFG